MADSLILCANSRKIVRNESQFNNISSMLLFHFHWYVGNAAHLLSHLLQFASVIEFSASIIYRVGRLSRMLKAK